MLPSSHFPKSCRLRKRKDFERLRQGSKNLKGKWIYLVCKKNQLDSPRLGLAVTKKFGKAVLRNRFKRIVRAAFRALKHELLPVDIIVRPKPHAQSATSEDIRDDLLNLLKENNC